ncbi:hypothetical protein ENUP19_0251G0003 [Entamoeba nuttalli]|uniref:Uncharacterized protein n=2 Tax=Entamoeba nuttalli TaxID=412467 RepID=K2GY63_ENTNP|nr:hypothetical protein ENU1_099610 [Entamoeba nuttalli P19]EKE40173.1 hypothetical protein ENU1_099610 [Entamoeba nuttalli P19]|eukprot:XP_008857492.1 hypothetical protein ENU1_099610 [Entamoeba nuttalli P19]
MFMKNFYQHEQGLENNEVTNLVGNINPVNSSYPSFKVNSYQPDQREYNLPPPFEVPSSSTTEYNMSILNNSTYRFPSLPDTNNEISTYVVPSSNEFNPFPTHSIKKEQTTNLQHPFSLQPRQSVYNTNELYGSELLKQTNSLKDSNQPNDEKLSTHCNFDSSKKEGSLLTPEQYMNMASQIAPIKIETITNNDIIEDDITYSLIKRLMLVGILFFPFHLVVCYLFRNSNDKRVQRLSMASGVFFILCITTIFILFILTSINLL